MRVDWRTAVVVLGVILSAPVIAAAQRDPALGALSLEELLRIEIEPVFGASKRVQPVTEAPASVTIVTAEEIARYGYRTLADILRGVRGFSVTYDRSYHYLGARGFAPAGDFSTRILLLVDGHRMNDNIYEAANPGQEFGLDPATFSRVEIVRGPSSSLYGTSAFFAVVNVILKKGGELDGGLAAADAGSVGAKRAHVAYGRELANGFDLAVSASSSREDGPRRLYFPVFDAHETNHGVAERLDDERVQQLFGRFKFRDFTITTAFGRRDKQVPTAPYGTIFGDPRLNVSDERAFVDAEYNRLFGVTRVAVRAYLDHYYYEGTYPFAAETPGTPDTILNDYSEGKWAGLDGRVTRDLPLNQSVTVGGEFRNNFRQAQGGSYEHGTEADFAVDGSSIVSAAYVQDEIALHRRVRVNIGARYDVYAGFGRFTPRAAVIANSSSRQAFKYLYGTAFRAPNAWELDYFTSGVRNDDLGPETITSHEVVWERYTRGWLRTSASLYWNRVADLLTLQSDESTDLNLIYRNRGEVDGRGAELEGEWRAGRYEGLLSYARQRAIDRETNQSLTNSPHHAVKLRFSVRGARPGSSVAFETQYASRRRTLAGASLEPVVFTNATVIHPLATRVAVVGSVRNMFNKTYADPGSEEHLQDSIEQNGRTFTAGVRWHFGPKE
jgi:outer membrane receptor for ferrienterochelin and colicins